MSDTKKFEYDDFKYDDFKYDDFTYNSYNESNAVTQAQKALNTLLAQKPGAYQSQWQTQLDDTINKILNREKFSYDLNGDALYQQYKDKYIQQGKLAMGDAIGQASAMTGGYGNSYAQSVGQQAYQAQLNNLNDIVPELYAMAYDKYNQEGQDLYNQYSMLGAEEDRDYGRYRDTVTDWNTERDYLANRYDSERDYDYSKYVNERDFAYGKYADDRNFAYGQYSDDRNLAYGQYSDDKSYAYNEYRNAIDDEKWEKEYALNVLKTGHTVDKSGDTEGEVKFTPIETPTTDNENTTEASWTLVDDGGMNWGWGGRNIDNNAKVKDPLTGETKKLSQVKEERTQMYIDAGYSKKTAKALAEDDVLEIQRQVGA